MTSRETARFIRSLGEAPLTRQQRKTLRGQALAGDLAGAERGLITILQRRRQNEHTENPKRAASARGI